MEAVLDLVEDVEAELPQRLLDLVLPRAQPLSPLLGLRRLDVDFVEGLLAKFLQRDGELRVEPPPARGDGRVDVLGDRLEQRPHIRILVLRLAHALPDPTPHAKAAPRPVPGLTTGLFVMVICIIMLLVLRLIELLLQLLPRRRRALRRRLLLLTAISGGRLGSHHGSERTAR